MRLQNVNNFLSLCKQTVKEVLRLEVQIENNSYQVRIDKIFYVTYFIKMNVVSHIL